VISVLKAERVRANAGPAMRRRMWKNLVFTGGPSSGKSRAAAAVGESYRKLGVLSSGRVQQMAAGDLAGSGPEETGKLVGEAFRLAAGGILLVNGVHAWDRLPDHGDQVLRRLYENLNEYRDTLDDEVTVISPGRPARCTGCCTATRRWPRGSAPSLTSPATRPRSSPSSSPSSLTRPAYGSPLQPGPRPQSSSPGPRAAGPRGTRGSRSRC